jgi:3-methyladenine DNA glycosylase Mpg
MMKLFKSQISASLVMISAGTAYVFSMYGTQLQDLLNFTPTEIAFAAACCNAGNYLGGPAVG